MMKGTKMGRIALVAVTLGTGAGCIPSIKDTFVSQTYPVQPPVVPPRDLSLSFAANLLPTLLVGYAEPAAAAGGYESLAADPNLFDNLDTLGACLAVPTPPGPSPGVPQDHWIDCVNASEPFLRSCEGALASGPDRAQAALALASTAEVFYAYRLATTNQAQAAPLTPAEKAAFLEALGLAARLMRCDPSNADATGQCDLGQPPTGTTPRVGYPTLTLSGGSANGAFTAGYVVAMLGAREQAFAAAAGDPTKLAQLEQERFGGGTGTSVGSLIAQLLDLYFTSIDATTLPPATPAAQALSACLGGGPLLPRAASQCALTMLEDLFTQSNEWDLLCVEKGSVLSLLDKRDHLLRFDPLYDDIVIPYLTAYRDLLLQNDFIRVAMSVDYENNVVLGLDERACRLPGMGSAPHCMGTGILASIVLPVFVRAVPVVYSGLRGGQGESGFWLDGGVRSGTPALQSLSLASLVGDHGPRVLAINTGRVQGLPAPAPTNALGVTFATMGQFSSQVQDWEMGMASLYGQVQRARGCYLSAQLGYGGCGASAGAPPTSRVLARANRSPLGGLLMPVFVPEHVPDYYSAAGYAFDPEVMTGLFYWGQKTFLDSRDQVLTFLGWPTIQSEAGAWMTTRAQQVDAVIQSSYATSPPVAVQQQHLDDRRALLDANIRYCN